MELWIRSQNKCKLRKTDIINYNYEAGKHIVDCNGYPCGVYESKKRCLEIIDEIQKLLEAFDSTKPFLNIDRDGFLDYKEITKNVITYQMPEK